MKHLAKSIPLIVIMTMGTSSMIANGNELYGTHTATDAPRPTATQNAQVRVKSRIPKPKLFRSNPHRLSYFVSNPDLDISIIDEDLITSYRRRDLNEIKTDTTPDNPEGLSERIRWQLFLARQAALIVHQQKHNS